MNERVPAGAEENGDTIDAGTQGAVGMSIVEVAALERLRRLGGEKLLREMITLFLANAPGKVAAAAEGVVRGDLGAVERAGHSLKSTAANVGAAAVRSLAGSLEAAAAAGDRGRMASLVAALQDAMESTVTELIQHREDVGA